MFVVKPQGDLKLITLKSERAWSGELVQFENVCRFFLADRESYIKFADAAFQKQHPGAVDGN